jgi:hypothetical protein
VSNISATYFSLSVQKKTLETIAKELEATGSSLLPGEELVYVTCSGSL